MSASTIVVLLVIFFGSNGPQAHAAVAPDMETCQQVADSINNETYPKKVQSASGQEATIYDGQASCTTVTKQEHA